MPEMPEPRSNPYPGPRSFEATDAADFFGRSREARQLLSLVVARRAVLLFSPSGAGKTSLIQAGLLGELSRQRRTVVLPTARVAGKATDDAANIFVANVLRDLFDFGAEETTAGLTLAAGLAQLLEGMPESTAGRVCLVLDQFEEIFTARADFYGQRETFFQQLREALDQNTRVTLLVAMREDCVAQLEPYLDCFPDRLRTRLRLDLLDQTAAREAVDGPARRGGAHFAEDALDRLIDDLRGGSPYVDPVQLQVVCRRLWERLGEATEITLASLKKEGDVNDILAGFYSDAVAKVAKATQTDEGALRAWIGDNLITEGGIRDQVLAEGGKVAGLDESVVRALENSRLVRCETRRGVPFYELAHDRLVIPVRRENESWSWAKKLVEAGQRRSRQRRMKWAAVYLLVLLAGLGLMAYSVADWVLLRGLDLKARALADTDPGLALLLAVANAKKQPDGGELIAATDTLVAVIESNPHLERYLERTGRLDRLVNVGFSADGKRVGALYATGDILRWDVQNGSLIRERWGPGDPPLDQARPAIPPEARPDWLPERKSPLLLLAWSPDGRRLVSTKGSTIVLWSVAEQPHPADRNLKTLKNAACGIANRPLTEDEWCDYVGPSFIDPVCDRNPGRLKSLEASFRCVSGGVPSYFLHLWGKVHDRGQSFSRRFQ